MTRSFQSSPRRARRITQPMIVVRLRDPSIRTLGFTSFRLARTTAGLAVIPYSDPKNPMTAFVR